MNNRYDSADKTNILRIINNGDKRSYFEGKNNDN